MAQKEWQSSFVWDAPPRPFLNLRNTVMERICQFLPTQRDRYELCLVHPTWLNAASDVLWEAPQFRDPVTFQSFLKSVTMHKRLALAVRTLCLVLRDEEQQTVFRPIMHSELSRHMKKDNVLTRRELIMHFVQQCEKLKSLKIYGWQLNPNIIEAIGMELRELESITIVGSNPSFCGAFISRNLLARLKELHLDGDFVIDEHFAEIISTRAKQLKSLQISLSGMERKALIRLCSGTLDLEKITLTKAQHMTDVDVQGLVQSFPNLRVFVLEGTDRITANSLLISLSYCMYLKHVEVRAKETSMREWSAEPLPRMPKLKIPQHHHLETLIVENLSVPYDILSSLPALPHLATLGLRNCMHVGDTALNHVLDQTSRLTTIQLIHCAGLTEKVLQRLCEVHSKLTLRKVHIERCGPMKQLAVYKLCCKCAKTLKLLRLIGYTNITNSVLKDYAIKNTDADTIVLDERLIDALANADLGSSPDLMDLPKNRTLTGEQIVKLSKILNLTVTELEEAMDKAQENDPRDTSMTGEFTNLENKHLSRVTATEKSLGNQRPTTPALWAAANHSAMDEYLPQMAPPNQQVTRQHITSQYSMESSRNTNSLIEQAERFSAGSLTSQSMSSASSTSREGAISPAFEREPKYDSGDMSKEPEESNSELDNHAFADSENVFAYSDNNAYETGDNELADSDSNADNEFAEEDNNTYDMSDNVYQEPVNAYVASTSDEAGLTTDEWPSLTAAKSSNKASELNLGGWGSTNALPWAKKISSTVNSHTKPHRERASSEQNWTPYTLEQHELEWRQITLQTQVTKPAKRKNYSTHIKTLESDGWGTPKGYTAWNDLRQQGYAYDVLEKQKKTDYWGKSDGKWKILNPEDPVPEPENALPRQSIASAKLAAQQWPTIEKVSSAEQRRRQQSPIPTPSKKTSSSPQQPLSNVHQEHIPQFRDTDTTTAALSSEDESINWDEDDGITIKTSPSQTHRAIYTKGAHKTPVPDQPRGREPATNGRSGASRSEPPPGKLAGRWSEFKDIDLPTTTATIKEACPKRSNDFLVDTSDAVQKANDFGKADNLQTSLLDSAYWRDISSLSAPMQEPLQPEHSSKPQSRKQLAYANTSIERDTTTVTPSMAPIHVSTTAARPSNDDRDSSPMDMVSSNMKDAILEEALESPPLEPSVPSPSSTPVATYPLVAPIASTVSTQPMDLNENALLPSLAPPLSPSRPISAANSLSPNRDDRLTTAKTPDDVSANSISNSQKNTANTTATSSTKKHIKLGSYRFELPNRADLPPIQLYEDVAPEDSVAEYCKTHDIEDLMDNFIKVLKPRYNSLHTNRVLKRANSVRKKKIEE
ncbi:hypothetical protein BX666DRAFT_2028885 [Dichotomocladium elegans]|nr:hypothetical protein BX666DRAFT_2028885 [Dichotomocladium elegans]